MQSIENFQQLLESNLTIISGTWSFVYFKHKYPQPFDYKMEALKDRFTFIENDWEVILMLLYFIFVIII